MAKKTKSPEGLRNIQLKFYVTKQYRDAVNQFLEEHRELGSMGDFGIAAFNFFMQRYIESGFRRDRDGFPIPNDERAPDEEHVIYSKPRKVHRPKSA